MGVGDYLNPSLFLVLLPPLLVESRCPFWKSAMAAAHHSRLSDSPRPEFPGSSDFSFRGISAPFWLAGSQGILWWVTCLWLFPLAITGGRVPHWPGVFSQHPREFSSVQPTPAASTQSSFPHSCIAIEVCKESTDVVILLSPYLYLKGQKSIRKPL